MDAIARGMRDYFEEQFQRVYLTEQRTRTEFDLAWQPAILGRKDHRDPSKNKLLAVDLEGVEDLPTVSRHHAALTMRGGSFFIETLQPRNPVYLDGAQLKPGIRYPLAAGAVIEVGRIALTFSVIS
jgi:pSer/pThr/pTyr-binding forkhead associated (FHA) protein